MPGSPAARQHRFAIKDPIALRSRHHNPRPPRALVCYPLVLPASDVFQMGFYTLTARRSGIK